MTKQRMFSCLLAACVFFAIEDRQLSAQATQPTTQTNPAPNNGPPLAKTKGTTSAPAPPAGPTPASGTAPATGSTPTPAAALPTVYGNPFNPMASTTGSAQQGAGSTSQNSSTGSDPCSANANMPTSIAFEPDPLGMAPGGAADSMSEPAQSIRTVNPAIKHCENGRILVQVETRRFYAYHVGDEIPITIEILADDGVQLNFMSLNQGVLGFDGSDFQLIPVREVGIVSRPDQHRKHATLYGIQLAVQTFVTRPQVTFNLELRYAIDVPPGVKQPNWRKLTTPDFVVTNTPVITASTDDELDEGSLAPAEHRSSWIQWPLMVAGLFMVVWFGFLRRLIARWNRTRPGRVIPLEEQAWNVFAKVFSDAQDYGEFGAQYLRNIDAALRKYLTQKSKVKIESLSIKEITTLLEDDPRLPTILSVLNKCESVVYARTDQPVKLSEAQIDELYEELKQLVPQPEE